MEISKKLRENLSRLNIDFLDDAIAEIFTDYKDVYFFGMDHYGNFDELFSTNNEYDFIIVGIDMHLILSTYILKLKRFVKQGGYLICEGFIDFSILRKNNNEFIYIAVPD